MNLMKGAMALSKTEITCKLVENNKYNIEVKTELANLKTILESHKKDLSEVTVEIN